MRDRVRAHAPILITALLVAALTAGVRLSQRLPSTP